VGGIDCDGEKSHISTIREKALALSGSVLGFTCRELGYEKNTQRNNSAFRK
jgi:hypothetical protein